jgi:hypothetical protein
MKKTIKITESELINLVRKVLTEESNLSNLKEKKDEVILLCSPQNEFRIPPKMICKRPTEIGEMQNNKIVMRCDEMQNPVVVAGDVNSLKIEYDCSKKQLSHAGLAAYEKFENIQKQQQIDSKWLSQFCPVIQNNSRLFKSCSSKVN